MRQRFITATALALLAAAPGLAAAEDEAGLWQQCGGVGYTGPVKCVAGAVCVKHNDWYRQYQSLRWESRDGAEKLTRSFRPMRPG